MKSALTTGIESKPGQTDAAPPKSHLLFADRPTRRRRARRISVATTSGLIETRAHKLLRKNSSVCSPSPLDHLIEAARERACLPSQPPPVESEVCIRHRSVKLYFAHSSSSVRISTHAHSLVRKALFQLDAMRRFLRRQTSDPSPVCDFVKSGEGELS